MKNILVIWMLLCSIPVMPQCLDNIYEDYDYCLREISIEGSTNVNNFTFWYENPLYSNALNNENNCTYEPDSGIMDFNIPVQSFRGSISAMRNDFLTLLKASEHPEIIVGIEKKEFDCIASGISADYIDLLVTLAGTQKAVHANYSTRFDSNNRIVLSGATRFLLSDFQLVPPEKALGLVRVQNEVFIKFDIVISNTQINSNQALN